MQEAKSIHEVDDIARASAAQSRTIYWFTVPPKMAAQVGITKLGFAELFAHEEMACADRAQSDQVRVAFELAKESLRRVDDAVLSTGDGTTDVFWAGRGSGLSKIRQLVLAAYNRVHVPDAAESESFLGSMETAIG